MTSSKKDALDRAKLNLSKFRTTRTPSPPSKRPPDLPPSAMRPMPGVGKGADKGGPWQESFAKGRGAGFLQADEVAQLPNPLVWNWPGSRGVLYTWCHNHYHDPDNHPVSELLSPLATKDIRALLEALDSFKISDLASVGAMIYEGLVDESEKRQSKVRVAHADADPLEDEHEADAEKKQLKRL